MLKRGLFVALIMGALCLFISLVAYRVGFLFVVGGLLCFLVALFFAVHQPWQGRARRVMQWIKCLVYAFTAIGLISFILVQGMILSGWPRGDEPQVDCIIVLGAGLNGDRLSWVLYSRMALAADYLNTHPQCVAIVTGGQGPGETITEALAMERYLVAQGIASHRIYMEEQATNTVENMRFSREILVREGLLDARIAVLSNSFHLYRAKWLAGYLGLEVDALGAPTPHFPLTPLNSYLREYFSIVLMYAKALTGAL